VFYKAKTQFYKKRMYTNIFKTPSLFVSC